MTRRTDENMSTQCSSYVSFVLLVKPVHKINLISIRASYRIFNGIDPISVGHMVSVIGC